MVCGAGSALLCNDGGIGTCNPLTCIYCLPVKVGVMLLDCLDSLGVVLDDLGVAAGVPVGGGGPAIFCVLAAKLAYSNKMN